MAHAQDVDCAVLARKAVGLSGAEIAAVCTEAAVCAMQEDVEAERVEMRHLLQALDQCKPRITQDMLDFYARYAQNCAVPAV
mmetsp:Transcript_2518/g.3407  ORF Transcript_2518/g.3407 Transcript_2518/m.3407 type:complete len:82 (+) Transcript_2518:252-497(+)|eukprot:CAMPEP_0175096534 /NCGR_PEP_ID=MMETSP0086_2-20121207/4785_1 /TAXON_ID=136419 /ORGANISM="Unknown Unknown, Strain D1" /LENGTH=81 /DNA_ID=CAMNT_0016369945 /DNA_START=300 /DNA_END=545 /DNA_ORIENTATION=+